MNRRAGLTMVELMVVLTILVAVAALVVPLISSAPQDAQATVTMADLVQVRDAYIRLRNDNPFRADGQPLMANQIRMGHLFKTDATIFKPWDPLSKTGWHGPYLKASGAQFPFTGVWAAFGTAGGQNEDCLFDGFSHADGRRPIVIRYWTDSQGATMAWVQSAGPDGTLRNESSDGPPTLVENGTLFANMEYDDLTLRVFP